MIQDEIRRPHSRIVGSTAFMPERYGEKLTEIAVRILQGELVPPAVYMDHVLIHGGNIDVHYPK
jgi:ribose transport system substrate-binding protein